MPRTVRNFSPFHTLRCFLRFAALCAVSAASLPARAQQPQAALSPTPPLGWNSWDSYGLTVNEAQVHENATVLHDKLLPFGWKYVVVDEGWYFPNPEDRPHPEKLQYAMDEYGRFLPDTTRFPSSATGASPHQDGQSLIYPATQTRAASKGLTELAAWVHANGMLFGIHIIRGIPKETVRLNLPIANSGFHALDAADTADSCPWDPTSYGVRDNAAGQAWYDALIRQYSDWGVDFLKVDCIADHPYRRSEILQLHRAIEKNGNKMLLSLSPGPTALDHAAELAPVAQMWRISNDIWDLWESDQEFPQGVKSQFARLAKWSGYTQPGNWPDADMLPLGELRPRPDVGPGPRSSRLSQTEQQTQMTLWAVARSPLILGSNLTLLSTDTLRLLTNRDLLRVNQTAQRSHEALHQGDLIAWVAELPQGQTAIAFFNLGESPMSVTPSLGALGLGSLQKTRWKDVWSGADAGRAGTVQLKLPPHGSAMLLSQR